MPRQTWDNKADWDRYYKKGAEGGRGYPSGIRPEVKLHYHRSVREVRIGERAAAIGLNLGPAAFNKGICIVGGAFGWLGEALLAEGFTRIVVTDTSAYVQAEKDNSDEAEIRVAISAVGLDPDSTVIGSDEKISPAGMLAELISPGNRRPAAVEILDADILTSAGRTEIRSAVQGGIDIVITETVLESLEDAEAIALSDAARLFPGPQTVVHLVYTLDTGPDAVQDPTFNWKTLVDWKLLIPADIFIDASTYEVTL